MRYISFIDENHIRVSPGIPVIHNVNDNDIIIYKVGI